MDESVPQYVRDLAANLQKDSLALADAVLRYDSEDGVDVIALMATRGKMAYSAALEAARELASGVMTAEAGRALFDPQALSSLARIATGRPGPGEDFSDAADLYQALRLVRGNGKIRGDAQRLDPQTNLAVRRFDYVERILPALDIDETTRWMFETELLNPAHQRPGFTEAQWLARFNQVFDICSLSHIAFLERPGTFFDRITSAPPTDQYRVDGPLVTVIMSVFKPDQSLRTALESLINQTWRNLEILLVDDCSPPEFEETIHEATELDDRIKLLRMPQNGGTYKIRNYAMARAEGEFIAFQDSDDWSHPERIARQMIPLLEDDACMATFSRSIRVYPDLGVNNVGNKAMRLNASSIIFRRDRVLEELGDYDEVRKGADSEFSHRLELVFGEGSVQLLDVPLALVQLTRTSLSRSEFRFRWEHGSRVAYRESYKHWHLQIERGRESPLLDPKAARRFHAPERVLHPGEPAGGKCDVLLVSDWRSGIGRYHGADHEVRALVQAGLSTAVAQTESIRFALRRRQPPMEAVMGLQASKQTRHALWSEPLHTRLILVRDPELLSLPRPSGMVNLSAARLVIAATHPPRAPENGWLTYDPAVVESNARQLFGAEPVWLPAHGGIAEALTFEGAKAEILPSRKLAVVAPVRRRSFRGNRADNRPVVGTTAIEVPNKDRPTLEKLMELLPCDNSYDVRIRMPAEVVQELGGKRVFPPNWLILTDVEASSFLCQLDFYVGVPMRSWGPELSWATLEAMANGCVAILDPAYEEFFGGAALYTGDHTAKSQIDALTRNPAAFALQQRLGYELVAELSAASFADFVTHLASPENPDRK